MAYGAGEPTDAPLRAVRDLAGTPVADAGGRPIGALYGALAEADTGLIRYFDLSLDEQPRHVLVPIGHARVHEPNGDPAVRLRAAVLDDLLDVPVYDPDAPFDAASERALLAAHGRCFYGERYYAHPSYDHTGLYAGDREVLTGSSTAPAELAPLGLLTGLRVAAGDEDPRDWPVAGEADEPLGRVADLIVDPAARAVRYLAIEADDGRVVLLPVGFALLDRDARSVRAPGILADDLASLPAYHGQRVDRPFEEAVRAALLRRLVPHRRDVLPDFQQSGE